VLETFVGLQSHLMKRESGWLLRRKRVESPSQEGVKNDFDDKECGRDKTPCKSKKKRKRKADS
jgi:hypothetical protein